MFSVCAFKQARFWRVLGAPLDWSASAAAALLLAPSCMTQPICPCMLLGTHTHTHHIPAGQVT